MERSDNEQNIANISNQTENARIDSKQITLNPRVQKRTITGWLVQHVYLLRHDIGKNYAEQMSHYFQQGRIWTASILRNEE